MFKRNVYFRADGNSKIGFGHVVRCAALAEMLKDDFNCTFLIQNPSEFLINEIENVGAIVINLPESQEYLNEAKQISKNYITKNDIVVLDGYQFGTDYQLVIRIASFKLVLVDDLHDKQYCADLIINHTPDILEKDYITLGDTRFALGIDYVLLRSLFLNQAKKTRFINEIKTVLICFGGSDNENFTEKVLNVLLDFSLFRQIIVVTGITYRITDSFSKLVESDSRIEHRHNLDRNQMLEALLDAEVAIVPSSSILFEVCACGCIPISGMIFDNQKFVYNYFKKGNLIIDAKSFQDNDVISAMNECIYNKPIKNKIIDGRSGNRLLSLFIEFDSTVREVSLNDCTLLFEWVNDSEVRSNSIIKGIVHWNDHLKWFTEKMNSSSTKMYVLEYQNQSVGQIRFDKKEDYWLIDYSIAKKWRGKGFGKIIVNESIKKFSNVKFRAFVKTSNIGSSKVFESLCFNLTETIIINSESYYKYEYQL